ncbi:apolipoprotein D-like [Eucyclogobius newberryi]|uniref:apolipoprotein D-like n=1 Tax=Eucyclogobius newberryi TaxID=166745 RepID=UPI003B5C5D70
MQAVQVISLTLLCAVAGSAQLISLGSCPKPAVQANFDTSQYIGQWYEIEKLPTGFQKGQCAKATYSPKSPGVIGVVNKELLEDGTINSIEGSAAVKNPEEPAKLQVSFNGTPPGPYWVLSTDYKGHSLVYGCQEFGGVKAELSWILSREPTISEETRAELYSILTAAGVDVAKMVPTNQDRNYCSPMDE